jgi:hypothetical protein
VDTELARDAVDVIPEGGQLDAERPRDRKPAILGEQRTSPRATARMASSTSLIAPARVT